MTKVLIDAGAMINLISGLTVAKAELRVHQDQSSMYEDMMAKESRCLAIFV